MFGNMLKVDIQDLVVSIARKPRMVVVPQGLWNTWQDVVVMWYIDKVPSDVCDYFWCELHRTRQRRRQRQQESFPSDEIADERNVNSDHDEELPCISLERRHMLGEYMSKVGNISVVVVSQAQGSQGGGLMNLLRRSSSWKGKGAKEVIVQTRIYTRRPGQLSVSLQEHQLARLVLNFISLNSSLVGMLIALISLRW